MYDQFSAQSENDLLQLWRNQGGDNYALSSIINHWRGYISDSDLDTIQQFGITAARIPVGYWIVDAPTTGGTMYDYGFNYEGFATGGLNQLEAMLVKLKQRNIRAVIDLHAVPGAGSSCNSYAGVMESDVESSFWQGTPPSSNQPHYSSTSLALFHPIVCSLFIVLLASLSPVCLP